MTKLLRGMRAASNAMLYFAASLLLLTLLLAFLDVVARNLKITAVYGTSEILIVAMMIIASLALPDLQINHRFLAVDLLDEKLRGRWLHVQQLFVGFFQTAFIALLVWRVWIYVQVQAAAGRNTDVLKIPQYLPYSVSLIALILLVVICAIQLGLAICTLFFGADTQENLSDRQAHSGQEG